MRRNYIISIVFRVEPTCLWLVRIQNSWVPPPKPTRKLWNRPQNLYENLESVYKIQVLNWVHSNQNKNSWSTTVCIITFSHHCRQWELEPWSLPILLEKKKPWWNASSHRHLGRRYEPPAVRAGFSVSFQFRGLLLCGSGNWKSLSPLCGFPGCEIPAWGRILFLRTSDLHLSNLGQAEKLEITYTI